MDEIVQEVPGKRAESTNTGAAHPNRSIGGSAPPGCPNNFPDSGFGVSQRYLTFPAQSRRLFNAQRVADHHSRARVLPGRETDHPGHAFDFPGSEEMKNRVISSRFLDGGAPVEFEQKGNRLFLRELPVPLPDPIATTIVLQVEGEPEPITPQTSFWIPGEPAA